MVPPARGGVLSTWPKRRRWGERDKNTKGTQRPGTETARPPRRPAGGGKAGETGAKSGGQGRRARRPSDEQGPGRRPRKPGRTAGRERTHQHTHPHRGPARRREGPAVRAGRPRGPAGRPAHRRPRSPTWQRRGLVAGQVAASGLRGAVGGTDGLGMVGRRRSLGGSAASRGLDGRRAPLGATVSLPGCPHVVAACGRCGHRSFGDLPPHKP